jgi:hypothetical protein
LITIFPTFRAGGVAAARLTGRAERPTGGVALFF